MATTTPRSSVKSRDSQTKEAHESMPLIVHLPHRLKLPWATDDPLGTLVDPSHEPNDLFSDIDKAILIGDTIGTRLGTWIAEDNRLLIFDRPSHAKPYGIHFEPVTIRPERKAEIFGYSPWQGLLANNGCFSTCRLEFHASLISDERPVNLYEKIILDSVFIGSHEQLEGPIPLSRIGPRTLVNFHSGAPRACTFVNRHRKTIRVQAMVLGQLEAPPKCRHSNWTDEDERKLRKIPCARVQYHRHDSTATREPSGPPQEPIHFHGPSTKNSIDPPPPATTAERAVFGRRLGQRNR
jgi:hypothetical protein